MPKPNKSKKHSWPVYLAETISQRGMEETTRERHNKLSDSPATGDLLYCAYDFYYISHFLRKNDTKGSAKA